jgi:predicted AAA+ superfamily ATPase
VVLGPRQVGKSTMVQQMLTKMNLPFHSVSADGVMASNAVWLTEQWEVARVKKQALGTNEFLLVIDEIQKIKNWSETVKALWDLDTQNNTGIKLVLLGSSRLILQEGLTESLAGRFEKIFMGHWSLQEMETAFGYDAATYAWFGGYPGAATMIQDEARWKQYIKDALIETSILKDVLMLSRIEKPTLMKHLFELGCLYSGQILSFTKIMGQLHEAGNTTTLSHYLSLLDTAGLLTGIEKYANNTIRKRSSSPKFQVYNNALISAQSTDTFEMVQKDPAKWGRVVESAVGTHLLNQSLTEHFELSYWREGSAEVDFILKKRDEIIAIEVKSSKAAITDGMRKFKTQFTPNKMLLVGADGLPWEQFLKTDIAGL